MRILVTGGTGHLGQAIVSELKREHHQVRVLARTPGSDAHVEWITGDLATGDGLGEAVADVDVVIHAATNSPAARRGRFKLRDFVHSPADVDVEGTSALVLAAERAEVKHFLHVSIVGLEHLRRLPYSRRKLEAERIVRSAGVPWTIVRATGFYWLVERMFADMLKRPIVALPAHVLMEPVDSDEFAQFIVACVGDGPGGDREGFAGPETLTMSELMEQYLAARGQQRRIRRAPLPKKVQAALTASNTSPGGRVGTTTWAQWLGRSAPAQGSRVGLVAS
jgi:uncharacterized protein YbjT (DUF2867 family)